MNFSKKDEMNKKETATNDDQTNRNTTAQNDGFRYDYDDASDVNRKD